VITPIDFRDGEVHRNVVMKSGMEGANSRLARQILQVDNGAFL
jgi:hypothetical protein